MSYLGVSQAAENLGISPRRVRQLIDSGDLIASRVGRAWLLDVSSVQERSRSRSSSGRPLAFKSVWRLAALADNPDSDRLNEEGLSASERWRMRRALAELLDGADLRSIDSKLRARNDRVEHRFAHPAVLEKLAGHKALILSGLRAAIALGSDLVADEQVEAYVREEDVGPVSKRFRWQEVAAGDANVHLRVVSDSDWSWKGRVAPRLIVAADLSHSYDARVRRVAQNLLKSVGG